MTPAQVYYYTHGSGSDPQIMALQAELLGQAEKRREAAERG